MKKYGYHPFRLTAWLHACPCLPQNDCLLRSGIDILDCEIWFSPPLVIISPLTARWAFNGDIRHQRVKNCGHLTRFQTTSSASNWCRLKWKPRLPAIGFILRKRRKMGQCPCMLSAYVKQVCLSAVRDATPNCWNVASQPICDNGRFCSRRNTNSSFVKFCLFGPCSRIDRLFKIPPFVTNIAVAICLFNHATL